MKKWIAILLSVFLLWGCSAPAEEQTEPAVGDETGATVSAGKPGKLEDMKPEELFSDRDYETEYEADGVITLSGTGASCGSKAVRVESGKVIIADEGTYVVTGTLQGMLVVDADKEDKVQVVLSDAHITSLSSAALYVLQADKVFLTLEGDNHLENGGSFVDVDENSIDGAVFAKDDLTINGGGTLTVTSPAGHGIVAKDELTITGGSITVTCAGHGLEAKDSVAIAKGTFTLDTGKDGIHAEDDEDASMGYVYIADGSFAITAAGDGISANSCMWIDGGVYAVKTGGGAENGEKKTSDGWGGHGGRPGMGGFGGQQESSEDSTSIKGIKAGDALLINEGNFTINSADDALHSNDALTVCGGSFRIATGDDGLHADEALSISAGVIVITESYEGLEGMSVTVSGGEISLVASDDGINAAGGTDGSGFGGRGGDMFGGRGRPGGPGGMGGQGGSSDSFIRISGGTVDIQASGDGIDSNGTLEITGGETTVCGPTKGDTAVLDYDISGTITGGSFIGTGSYMMAQSFSFSEQGVIALSVGNQAAGTAITLTDSKGNVLIDHQPALNYAIVILSVPEMVKGETYTVTVGQQSGEFEAG